MKSRFISNDEGCDQAAADIEYAASIRTKDPCNPLQDLTDAEIEELMLQFDLDDDLSFARAVIAAYKEKNK